MSLTESATAGVAQVEADCFVRYAVLKKPKPFLPLLRRCIVFFSLRYLKAGEQRAWHDFVGGTFVADCATQAVCVLLCV